MDKSRIMIECYCWLAILEKDKIKLLYGSYFGAVRVPSRFSTRETTSPVF